MQGCWKRHASFPCQYLTCKTFQTQRELNLENILFVFPVIHYSTRSLKIIGFIVQWLHLGRKEIVYVDTIFPKASWIFEVVNL